MKSFTLFLPILLLSACQKNIDPTSTPLVIPKNALQTPTTEYVKAA